MSYGLTANDWTDATAGGDAPGTGIDAVPAATGVSEAGLIVLPADAPPQVYRSALVPIAFAVPVLISGLAYVSGGSQAASDLSFVIITALCAVLLAIELLTFRRRMGIGAVLIYGGILIWFCHDYATNWFLHDYNNYNPYFPDMDPETVGRAMFYHCVFIEMMVLAFRFPVLRFLERLVTAVPEPADSRFYLVVVVTMLLFGWSAFVFCAEPLPVALFKAAFWYVPGVGQNVWLYGRQANVATGIGSYIPQIIQVGQVGGIAAATYALLIARNKIGQILGWADWAFWMAFSYQSERRGEIAFMCLPVLGVIFLKFQAVRDADRRARALMWLVATGLVVMGAWFAVQTQSADRMGQEFGWFRAAGNTMFSEGLNTWKIIPSKTGFAYDTFPGEMTIRPIPDTVWYLVTGPIPRVLWESKPIEKFALWYSAMISHDNRGMLTNGAQGTTVSTGAIGYWYFRYGPSGVIQGGLVYGFLMGLCERSLRRAQGRPLKVMCTMLFAAFIFRSYRDLWWHNLYPLVLGGAVLIVIIRLLFGARNDSAVPIPSGRMRA